MFVSVGLGQVSSLLFKRSFFVLLMCHHSWEDFLTICFCQCLTLRRASEYNRATKFSNP
jgi:hypothetical protein